MQQMHYYERFREIIPYILDVYDIYLASREEVLCIHTWMMQHLCDQLTIRAELIFPYHLWAAVVQHNRCNSTICALCSTYASIEGVLNVICIVGSRHLRIITIELSAITQKHEHTHMTQSQWGDYHNQFHQDQTRGEKNLDQMIFEDMK